MRNLLLLLIFGMFCNGTQSVRAAMPGQLFDQGNKLYEERKYKEAIAVYSTILSQNKISASLLFNLGDAYFRNGELGKALVNYRRAQLLAPRDPDVAANLSFARDTAAGADLHGPGARLLTYFTLNELAVACAALFWLACCLLFLVFIKPAWKDRFQTAIKSAVLLFVCLLAWLIASFEFQRQTEAVVVIKEASIRYGPLEESQAAYTAREGMELRVLDSKNEWLEVSDASNRMGWVKSTSVVIVSKRSRS